MKAQRLDRVLTAYRIGDADGDYPIYDATGSKLFPGRWNTSASPMIYAAEHYSTALLEKLVHGNGEIPPNQHFIEITIPNGVTYEMVTPSILPGWDDPAGTATKAYGQKWQHERRSLLLIVPSYVARMERNIIINHEHPDAAQIQHGLHYPVWWDTRLFPSLAGTTSPP